MKSDPKPMQAGGPQHKKPRKTARTVIGHSSPYIHLGNIFMCSEYDDPKLFPVTGGVAELTVGSITKSYPIHTFNEFPGVYVFNTRDAGDAYPSNTTVAIYEKVNLATGNIQLVGANLDVKPSPGDATIVQASSTSVTVRNTISNGRCFLEIEKRGRPSVYKGFTIEERDYFYTCAMRCLESGYYDEATPYPNFGNVQAMFRKWNKASLSAIVVFDDYYQTAAGSSKRASLTAAQKAEAYSVAKNAISALNQLNSGLTINLASSYADAPSNTVMQQGNLSGNADKLVATFGEYDVIMRFGIHDSMFTIENGLNGYWSVWGWADNAALGLSHSIPTIALTAPNWKRVVYEELIQSLGAGNDSHYKPGSLYFEPYFQHLQPEYYGDLDSAVYKLVGQAKSGDTAIDMINNLDTPCLLMKNLSSPTATFDISGLNSGQYVAKAWLATSDGLMSQASAPFTFTK